MKEIGMVKPIANLTEEEEQGLRTMAAYLLLESEEMKNRG